jgi:transcription termination factor Rho
MYNILQLREKQLPDLQEIGKEMNIKKVSSLSQDDLIYAILDTQAIQTAANAKEQPERRQPKHKRIDKQAVAGAKPAETSEQETPNVEMKVEPKIKQKVTEQSKKQENKKKSAKNKNVQKTENVVDKADTLPQAETKPIEEVSVEKQEVTAEKPVEQSQNNILKQNHNQNQNQQRQNIHTNQRNLYSFDDILKGSGTLEIMNEGYGFLRSSDYNYFSSPDDIYVSQSQIKLLGLKTGDSVEGSIRPPREGEKYFPLTKVSLINGASPELVRDRVPFEHLTPLFPDEKFTLVSGNKAPTSIRVVDLFSPIGTGQRGLLVAQPKTGDILVVAQWSENLLRVGTVQGGAAIDQWEKQQ